MAPADASPPPGGKRVHIEVVVGIAQRQVDRCTMTLPEGCTVADALVHSGLAARHPGLALDEVGLWGRRVAADTVLRGGDRVEVYRPLVVAPMEARRLRQRQQQGRPRARP